MDKGFTLIEVVISAALIAILILAIGSMNLLSVSISERTMGRDGAFNLARGLCELYNSQELSNSCYNSGAVYKYVDSIEEIDSLNSVYENKEGAYSGQELVSAVKAENYAVILEAVKAYSPVSSSYPVPEVVSLRVTVRENRPQGALVVLCRVR